MKEITAYQSGDRLFSDKWDARWNDLLVDDCNNITNRQHGDIDALLLRKQLENVFDRGGIWSKTVCEYIDYLAGEEAHVISEPKGGA